MGARTLFHDGTLRHYRSDERSSKTHCMSAPMASRRIHLFDSGLREKGGHHDHFARGLQAFAKVNGYPLAIYGGRRMDRELVATLGVRPTFRWAPYDQLPLGAATNPDEAHDYRANAFAEDLNGAETEITDQDLCLLPTATLAELDGLARGLRAHNAHPRVAALFHWGADQSLSPGSTGAQLARKTIHTARMSKLAGLHISATHQRLAASLSSAFETEVSLTPSVTFYPDRIPRRTAPQTQTLRLGVLGAPRSAKGADTLLGALTLCRSQPELKFVVQCHGVNGSDFAAALRRTGANVEVHEAWLSDPELAELITSLDCALLPYDQATYSAMVSGIFTLVAGLGVATAVPNGTWMSERVLANEAAGVIFGACSEHDLLQAISLIWRHRDSLAHDARERAFAWRDRYAGDAYLRRLATWWKDG